MNTGENAEALRKITDMIRKCSIIIIGLHFYFYCYEAFMAWKLTYRLTEQLMISIAGTGLFNHFYISKLLALCLLIVSLIGTRGKKDEKLVVSGAVIPLASGLAVYLLSYLLLKLEADATVLAAMYMIVTAMGYLLILHGGTLLTRLLKEKLQGDIFNKLQETFPQEERLLENEFSINLPAKYSLKGKLRNSWINIINPFRGSLLCGTPGSGKSYFVVRHVITQHIRKGFSMFVYDFKFPDLSLIAYNTYLKNKHAYKKQPKFYTINFDDLSRSHRCNPLDPASMTDITDATESSRTIMLGLNREWIKKSGGDRAIFN